MTPVALHPHATREYALQCARGHSLAAGLSLCSGELAATTGWVDTLMGSLLVLCAGPDPIPVSGAWS